MTDCPEWNPIARVLDRLRGGRIVALTGAGVSAESGIPTFRGADGYWTVGSREYQPQESATLAAFRSRPRDLWRWYLYRRFAYRRAEPNGAHVALVEMEREFGDRFVLITQNVDGLHRRAGSSDTRCCEVHGNIERMRCTEDCDGIHEVPDITIEHRDDPLADADYARLSCPSCGALARPHVLWFDEYYDENLYRSTSAISAAAACDLMLVVGSSGAASLPMHAVAAAAENGATVVDINIDANPFADFADDYELGMALRGSAAEWLPTIASVLVD